MFKEMERRTGSVCSAEEPGAAAVVSELQVSVFPSTELKRVLTDVLLAKIEKPNMDRY